MTNELNLSRQTRITKKHEKGPSLKKAKKSLKFARLSKHERNYHMLLYRPSGIKALRYTDEGGSFSLGF